MSNLVLELRPNEVMIVNGAPIRFRTKSRIELTAHARFLFGKQIMQPDQADSRRGGSILPCNPLTSVLMTSALGASRQPGR